LNANEVSLRPVSRRSVFCRFQALRHLCRHGGRNRRHFLQIGWLKWKAPQGRYHDVGDFDHHVVFGGRLSPCTTRLFIKWKPTVLYWLFGAVLGGADLLFRRNLIRRCSASRFACPTGVVAPQLSWAGFFAFMGAANLYVAFNFSTDTWVNFKLSAGWA